MFSSMDDEDIVNGVHVVHPECPQCVVKLFLSAMYVLIAGC